MLVERRNVKWWEIGMDSGQSNDITCHTLFPSSLVLVIRSMMENRIGGVTNGWIICVGGGGTDSTCKLWCEE